MKPSERIIEIAEQMVEEHKQDCKVCGFVHEFPTFHQYQFQALIKYLDEEYENKKSPIVSVPDISDTHYLK